MTGVLQGSVLGPLLWNIMYNNVLIRRIPQEYTIVGFAYNIAVIVMARYINKVELYVN